MNAADMIAKTLKANAAKTKDATVFEHLQWLEMTAQSGYFFDAEVVGADVTAMAENAGRTAQAIVWTISTGRTTCFVDKWLRSLSYKKLVDLVMEITAKSMTMGEVSKYLNALDSQIVANEDRNKFGMLLKTTYTRGKAA